MKYENGDGVNGAGENGAGVTSINLCQIIKIEMKDKVKVKT